MRTPDELTERFRARGLKVTPQRQCIFGVLHDSTVHPTAEAVHAEVVAHMPTVSLRTVYQTLNDLAAMGELVSLDLGTGSTRFDPTLAPHHHLVCEDCGRITDLYADFGEVAVPAGDEAGFTITATEIVFRGVCEQCSSLASAHDLADTGPDGPTPAPHRGRGPTTTGELHHHG